jgi:hypothetical protein
VQGEAAVIHPLSARHPPRLFVLAMSFPETHGRDHQRTRSGNVRCLAEQKAIQEQSTKEKSSCTFGSFGPALTSSPILL